MRNYGLVLMEILIVLLIVAIIGVLGVVNYTRIKEEALDKEARSNLKLIQAAEKIYHIEYHPNYYPTTGSETNIVNINDYLKVSLSVTGNKWNYSVDSSGTAQATRADSGGRQWTLPISTDEPCSGASCP